MALYQSQLFYSEISCRGQLFGVSSSLLAPESESGISCIPSNCTTLEDGMSSVSIQCRQNYDPAQDFKIGEKFILLLTFSDSDCFNRQPNSQTFAYLISDSCLNGNSNFRYASASSVTQFSSRGECETLQPGQEIIDGICSKYRDWSDFLVPRILDGTSNLTTLPAGLPSNDTTPTNVTVPRDDFSNFDSVNAPSVIILFVIVGSLLLLSSLFCILRSTRKSYYADFTARRGLLSRK